MTLLDNFREGDGDNGIMRSPLSAITLLDQVDPTCSVRGHGRGLSADASGA